LFNVNRIKLNQIKANRTRYQCTAILASKSWTSLVTVNLCVPVTHNVPPYERMLGGNYVGV